MVSVGLVLHQMWMAIKWVRELVSSGVEGEALWVWMAIKWVMSVLSLVGALALWAGGPKGEPLAFFDALYNAVSAVTETGLASVPIHRFSLCNQIILLLLMVVGGQVFTSAIPLFLRKLFFFSEPIPQKPSDCEIATHQHATKTYHEAFPPPSAAAETWVIFTSAGDDLMQTQKTAMDYEALVTLSWLTACYYVFSISIGFLICQICIVRSPHASAVLMQNHVHPGLFSIFATVSAFGNCGYILLDENMVPLQRSWKGKWKEKRNWRSEALKGLGAGYKLVVALFQSISARTGGMNAVNLSGFSTPTLFVAVVAMYVASYPIHIIKHPTRKCKGNILLTEIWKLRRKESFLFVATFLICFFERDSLRRDPLNFTFLNIIYEVISAYGNVGLTIGYSCSLKTIMTHTTECLDTPCAFSAKWSFGGQGVLILVMLFGRHRNLLEDIDWDIVFPINIPS
ncbi:hypothetical protein GOP47_0026321 [Adiantum capillus-veneris]|nr:hypothetical protein GOP47_0026321 [Adiantum capillus-veneris]